MLALPARGFDSCPMEGVPRAAEIVTIIAAGRGAEDGNIAQLRFSREHCIARA